MSLFLANPWGLLALFGVPAVVAIHLLRRKSREVFVSTLFLVEQALPSSEGGRRIRTLRNSLPLWAQILAVCALTWLLAQPRWIDESSVQTVVAVFDSSASMSAFREETLRAATTELARLGAVSTQTQWIFLRSDASRLGSGTVLSELLADTEKNWHPALGTHDTSEASRLARTLAGEKGTIVFFSDRPPEETKDMAWVATGDRIENAGFLGAQVNDGRWSALLKNFGLTAREIRWRMEGEPDWRTERLEAGAMTEVAGTFPAGTERVVLETDDDRFSFDNRLPILNPKPKTLDLRVAASQTFQPIFEPITRLAEPSTPATTDADVALAVYSPLSPGMPSGAAIVFVEDAGKGGKPLPGLMITENHPLMENLNWQGLIANDTLGVPVREGDQTLLWQGGRRLIFLRSQENKTQLVFNFDVRQSNATRLPAFPLLLHRFFGQIREEKPAYEAANVETRQTVTVAGAGTVRAPERPGFFSAKTSDGKTIFDGAAQFGDTRESDFRSASTGKSPLPSVEAIRQTNARGAFLDPLWAMVLAALMLWNWLLTGRPKETLPGGTELKLAR